jgi:RNA polymerase sigma-70 factor (ECF subfamily)
MIQASKPFMKIFAKNLLIPRRVGEYVYMSHSESTSENLHTLKVQQHFMMHQQALLAYLLSIVPNLQDAQDILQDAFLVVSRKADTWTEGTNFLAWGCAIVRYEALNYARSRKKRMVPLDEDVVELLHSESPPLDGLDARIERLRECLKRLSPRARELIMLRNHTAQLPEQIAASVNWSVNAVRVALTRARQALRECIEQRFALEDRS